MKVKHTFTAVGVSSALLVGGLAAIPTAGAAGGTISPSQFSNNLSAMTQLKPITAKGKGNIAVILPDTVSSARWQDFDAPLLKAAFIKAGLKTSQFTIQNAQGSASTQLTDAQAAISKGAKVIVLTALDSGSGAQIEAKAKAAGVKVVDYDRLVLGGSDQAYVSFDNVQVGKLLGQGLVACAKSWGDSNPQVIVMRGAPTDNNATLFANGYESVLQPLFKSGAYKDVTDPPGTWDPPTAATEFEQALTANPSANAALTPNDENAAPIITYLQQHGVKANTFPLTGQDATVVGLQNIISGYQCGTVYKPIFLEAEGAAAAAIYLRAGQAPPKSLFNGTTQDTQTNKAVPSVLLVPKWVTAPNIEKTIVADKFVPASQICTGSFAADCAKFGIK